MEILAEAMARGGVRHAFGVTGSGSSLLLIRLLQDRGVAYHPVAHEAAAAMMAGACCRDGNVRAAAISIKGPGFANFFPGVMSNAFENRPAMTVSEAYGDTVPSWRKHKRLDHRAVGAPVLKGYLRFDGTSSSVVGLLKEAEQEIPGPVHVDLCAEPARTGEDPHEEKASADSGASIREIIGLVRKARRPAVVLGSMVSRLLSERKWDIGVPVVTTAAAKGCLDERSEYAGGVVTGEVKELSPEQAILSKADLVVAFGLRNTEVVVPRRFDAPLVVIDVSDAGNGIHDGFEPMSVLLTPNLREDTEAIVAEISRKAWGEDVLRARRKRLEAELFGGGFTPAVVFRCLQESLDARATLVLDTGLFCTVGETIWKAEAPRAFCGSSNGRFMGTSIPTAIGVASGGLASPVVCVAGDGGIRPYLPEIRIAVEEKLPILFVLMSDGAYGTVAQSAGGGNVDRGPFTIGRPSWRRAVEGMECRAMEVRGIEDLGMAVAGWDAALGPLFVEMFFDPDAYMRSAIHLR